jgi:pimeloyl-ACP methyl ester carboxylesterase
MAAFCAETGGPRPLAAGHGIGAEILLRAVATRRLTPRRLVLMPNRMHRASQGGAKRTAWRYAARAAVVPGLDRALSHGARAVFRPEFGMQLSARGNPAARDLLRHAFADVGGNTNLAHSWAKFARRRPGAAQPALLEAYPHLDLPVLLLWADEDRQHPLTVAEEALGLLPDGQLRVLSGTGYLIAYDDPVGVAREISAFCG